MTEGRGAWTTRGKGNNKTSFARIKHLPRDGEIPEGLPEEETAWHQCVNLGVVAIQSRLIAEGHQLDDRDGLYRWQTKTAVEFFQREAGIADDGVCGPQTMTELLKPVILYQAPPLGINPKWIYGLARQESALDPAAQGWDTPNDRGIWQFNTDLDVTPEQASDINWAAKTVCNRWLAASEKYQGKGSSLRIDCCIMQHRSPKAADYLYATGQPFGPESAKYVLDVRAFAENWKG